MPDPSPDIEMGSRSSRKFSRREFFRMAGAAIVLGVKPETGKSPNDILSIETPEAKYFPIYESHSVSFRHPVSGKELKLLPPQDIFLYEYPRDSRDFVDPLTSPQAILDTELRILSPTSDSKRTYFIPRDHLEWLRENNTKICFEGYYPLQSDYVKSVTIMASEIIISASAGIQLLLHAKPKENGGKEVTRKQFLKLAAGLAVAWGLSPIVGLLTSSKTEVRLNALERVIIKANGVLSQTHPEIPIIFFRNIMLARKLQFLGEVASKEKGQKAQITYNVGKAHAGIEDFLYIGKDWTLAFLNMTSNSYLKAIIDANGGLENFCSNVLFDPNAQNPTKTILVDQELKSFLEKKLDLSTHS